MGETLKRQKQNKNTLLLMVENLYDMNGIRSYNFRSFLILLSHLHE